MTNMILKAILSSYEAELLEAETELKVFLIKMQGVGDHTAGVVLKETKSLIEKVDKNKSLIETTKTIMAEYPE